MSDTPWAAATELHRTLVEHGIVVLAVIADRTEAGWFTVHLDCQDKNNYQATVLAVLLTLPGVGGVLISDRSLAILWARQVPGTPA